MLVFYTVYLTGSTSLRINTLVFIWQKLLNSNQRIAKSKSSALPLVYAPITQFNFVTINKMKHMSIIFFKERQRVKHIYKNTAALKIERRQTELQQAEIQIFNLLNRGFSRISGTAGIVIRRLCKKINVLFFDNFFQIRRNTDVL